MGLYDPIRDIVLNDKWCTHCTLCGEYMAKKMMTTVLFKRQYKNPKTVAFLCDVCMTYLSDEYCLETE